MPRLTHRSQYKSPNSLLLLSFVVLSEYGDGLKDDGDDDEAAAVVEDFRPWKY
ncbi:hypothetical protein ZOSMA_77G00090 [Zostera marina]|uniref:Uncharacterized protein n=1 Tax=Zostera marina TaxID=29655 RepID=A0A0K9NQJ3_ZOSMR|nr:hypothetical protein ZOSMA_77G00090 [Zostera marina]